jgi:hypothetical protein
MPGQFEEIAVVVAPSGFLGSLGLSCLLLQRYPLRAHFF